ncbi:RNA polymerase sigma factor [Aeromicrobium sp. A1-2]|uniref:RNA polymerase sigma factor n=1 Tax=Aeromicrobium sp. A1-2 TaxID=2107713 RepID=UPI0013C2DF63|nr:sigma-70 family RNA polymerase sigma factor [Aeromicrobium sp. A1-2]
MPTPLGTLPPPASIVGRHARTRPVRRAPRWSFRPHARVSRLLARHGNDLMGVARTLTRDEQLAEQLVVDTLTAYDHGRPDHGELRTLAAGVMVAWLGRNRDEPSGPGSITSQIYDELHTLPDEQRTVLALCRFGGHTYREAAELLGLPAADVADLLGRAMRSLQAGRAPAVS